MDIKREMKLHNRFDIKVCDAVTGELKQEAVAFNVITNSYFQARLGYISGYGGKITCEEINRILVGTGTGTPAITDTALFTSMLSRVSTVVEEQYAYPTSYVTRQIKIEADEYNGYTITEVGLGLFYRSGLTDSATLLLTHAMLQDSEGAQIAIQKTDTDVIYINATLYCTVSQSGFGDNGIYPEAADNILVQWLLKGPLSLSLRTHRFALNYASELNEDYLFTKSFSFRDGTGDIDTLTYVLPVMTVLDSEWNPHIVKTFGIPGIGAFCFPDSTAFADYNVDHLVLGEGDEQTTEYSIKCPHIKSGTGKVYVDSTELQSSDFTIDYDSNCIDTRENYYTASMNCGMNNVSFGNLASKSPYEGRTYRDPLHWGIYPASGSLYANYCVISQANPVWIDFGTAKECNRIRIDNSEINSNYIDDLVIEYSNDNSNWTAVNYTRTVNQSTLYEYLFTFALTTARYWRVYIPNYNWSYSLFYEYDHTGTRDGTTDLGATFFIGRSVPGLTLVNPPASGETVEASYKLDMPYKTENNLLRLTCTLQLQRG